MLTDKQCKNAACPPDKKRARFTDAAGLYLEVSPAGSKRWFWKTCAEGKEVIARGWDGGGFGVQALEQGVESLTIATHEHGKAIAAIGCRGRARVRRQCAESDLAAFLDQSLDVVHQSHLPLIP
jgi:hypothetical protein